MKTKNMDGEEYKVNGHSLKSEEHLLKKRFPESLQRNDCAPSVTSQLGETAPAMVITISENMTLLFG